MTFEALEIQIRKYQAEGRRLFSSCSFQTHSLVLLHMLQRIDTSIPIYFINTGYHFPETLAFRDEVCAQYGIPIRNIQSPTPRNMQKDGNGRLLFTSDPDYCCYLNKTQAMEPLLKEFDIWINGVRADQSAVRKTMQVEQATPYRAIRFHPMLDWNARTIHQYRKEHQLPSHPLEEKGYFSIGCEPCTTKINWDDDQRNGRWLGMHKTECGLNTDLINESKEIKK